METDNLTRTQVIFELARYVHPMMYHKVIKGGTAKLSSLLAFYKEGGKIEYRREGGKIIIDVMHGRSTVEEADTAEEVVEKADKALREHPEKTLVIIGNTRI